MKFGGRDQSVRSFFAIISFCVLVAFSLFAPTTVRAAEITRKHHPWANFSPGAWRQTRTFVQVFDKNGRVVDWGVTEQRTTLEKVDEKGVTLQVEKAVWMAGKWCDQPNETLQRGFEGEAEGQKATIKDLDPVTFTIEGRKITCGVREIELANPKLQSVQLSRVVFNNEVAPYVLKRTTTIKDREKNTVLSETNTVAIGLDMLCLVADQLYSASQLRTTTKHALGTSVTLTYSTTEVPGGVVHECTKKLDKEGRLVERSVLELTDYGLKPGKQRPLRRRLPRRLRNWRLRAENAEKENKPAL